MKRLILLFAVIPIVASAEYYWCNGEKVMLEVQNNLSNMPVSASTQSNEKINQASASSTSYIYVHESDSMEIFIADKFNVKLKSLDDLQLLQQLASMYGAVILDDPILPLWFTLRCTDNKHNVLDLANLFYETGYFDESYPDFIGTVHSDCVNDPMFSMQWNLQHNGTCGNQYGNVDINFCNAHAITSGNPNTIIAVYDSGVELTHPDLNIYPLSYDVRFDSSPSTIKGSHGTSCAGIIAAKGNNHLGITGIAPSCPVMSITMPSVNARDTTSGRRIAKGFQFAAENGCSIISCSWSVNIPSDPFLNDVIYDVIQNGRNGLGCVVVFSAGNNNYPLPNYPASAVEEIIVVGAMSPCGERKIKDGNVYDWGSNYGEKLDLVAPGVSIPTTDTTGFDGHTPTDYTTDFHGTSSACPHVSAVAGLILSVNPTLTSNQVINIIESTAQKVGYYDYDLHPNRPNGKWHIEMGYGLVDAYEAVLAAQPKYIQDQVYSSGMEVYEYATEITAGYAVTGSKPYGKVILETGSDVTLRSMDKVVLKPGFHAKSGSKLHVKVDKSTTALSTMHVAPQRLAPYSSSTPMDDTEPTDEVSTSNDLESIESEMIQSTTIFTISGQLLQTIEGGERDAAHLPNGMYILQHRMSDGGIRSSKIIR